MSEETLFVWKVNGEPDVGTLQGYAALWREWKSGAPIDLSKTVLTWHDSSDPITWDVKVIHTGTTYEVGVVYEVHVLTIPGLPDEATVTVATRRD